MQTIKRPAGQQGIKNVISFTDNNIKKNEKSQDLIAKLFNVDDFLSQYYKLNLSIKEIKKTIDTVEPPLREAVSNILFKNWLKKSQFDKNSEENIVLEIETENIIIYNKITKKIERIRDINFIKAYIHTKYDINSEYLKAIKKIDIPIRQIVFDPINYNYNVESDNRIINIYCETEIRKQARKEAEKLNKIDINEAINIISNNYKNINIVLTSLFSKEIERKYFLNWLSYIVQTGKKTRNAIVVRGVQGTGKNLFFENVIRPFFSHDWTTTIAGETLESIYNANFENRLFVCFNEVQNYENKGKVSDKLKMIISDDELNINEKYIKIRTVKNYTNCIFYSNNTTPISVEGTDRRYSIFTANTPLVKIVNQENIGQLIENIKNELVNFYTVLYQLNYIENLAKTVWQNDEREIITKITTNFVDLASDLLAEKKFDEFIKYIQEELQESDEPDHTYLEEAEKQLKSDYLASDLFYSIYLQINNLSSPEKGNDEKMINFYDSLNRLKIMKKKSFTKKVSARLGLKITEKQINSERIFVWKFNRKEDLI